MRASIVVASLILLLTSVGVKEAEAQMSSVASGQTVTVNAHGVCYRVYNSSGTTTMIPWNSASEWSHFVSYRPGHMSLSSCIVRDPVVGEYYETRNHPSVPTRSFWNSTSNIYTFQQPNNFATGSFPAGATSFTSGGWTYYRGTQRSEHAWGIYRERPI
jgi:hypothetical protein